MNELDYRHGDSKTFQEIAQKRRLEDAKRPIPSLHHLGRIAGALVGEFKAIGQEIGEDIRSHWASFRQEVKRLCHAAAIGWLAATYTYQTTGSYGI